MPKDKDPIERIIQPLKDLVPGANTLEQLEILRRQFGDALLDFVNGAFGFLSLSISQTRVLDVGPGALRL